MIVEIVPLQSAVISKRAAPLGRRFERRGVRLMHRLDANEAAEPSWSVRDRFALDAKIR